MTTMTRKQHLLAMALLILESRHENDIEQFVDEELPHAIACADELDTAQLQVARNDLAYAIELARTVLS